MHPEFVVIKVSQLDFAYDTQGFRLRIDGLSVAAGQQVALIGPSGSGKSTFLDLLSGILLPAAGSIVVDGHDLSQLSSSARRDFRIAKIGLVFQGFELLEYLTVTDNLLLPFRINPSLRITPEVRERAKKLASDLGIADKLARFPGQLSQGEKQRVAIGRSLITEPKLLLADEPTGNLDPTSKKRALDLMLHTATQQEVTVIVVTHDHALLDRFEKVYEISDYYDGGAREPASALKPAVGITQADREAE